MFKNMKVQLYATITVCCATLLWGVQPTQAALEVITTGAYGTSIDLEWEDSEHDRFELEYTNTSTGVSNTIRTVELAYSIDDLAAQQEYEVQIHALDSTNTVVESSDVVTVQTSRDLTKRKMRRPRITSGTPAELRPQVRWSAAPHRNYVVDYELQLRNGKNTRTIARFHVAYRKRKRRIARRFFSRGRRYNVRMRAEYENGEYTRWSSPKSFRIPN